MGRAKTGAPGQVNHICVLVCYVNVGTRLIASVPLCSLTDLPRRRGGRDRGRTRSIASLQKCYALLKISRFVPLNIRPESSARKSKISAMSSGVMPGRRCGAAWRSISVSTAPGLMAHTRMLSGLPSTARISVRLATPAFETLYALRPGNFSTPFTPESDEKLIITPARCSAITRKASRQHRNVPRKLALMTLSHVAASISTKGFTATIPAQFTSTSTRPYVSITLRNRLTTSSSLETSPTIASTVCPAPSISRTTWAKAVAVRLKRATRAPSRAKRMAAARPMPRLAPVMMMTRVWILMIRIIALCLTCDSYEALKSYRVAQEQARIKAGERWVERGIVFANSIGGFLSANILRQLFRDLLKNAGLPHMRVHDLRHSSATILFAAGVQLKVVSKRLGHASIATTADIYSHVLPEMQQEVADKIDGLFKKL